MSFSVSPAVTVSEYDLTTSVPAVSTTTGAIAGVFRWGPVNQRVLVSDEPTLAANYGPPTNFNPETFFTAANFLAYGNQLYVVRAANTAECFAAIANTGNVANVSSQTVLNLDDYQTVTFDANTVYVAKYPGALGNSLRVSVCDSPNAYSATINFANGTSVNTAPTATQASFTTGSNTVTITVAGLANGAANTALTNALTGFQPGDWLYVGNNTIGFQYLQTSAISVSSESSNVATATISLSNPYQLSANLTTQSVTRFWEFYNKVNKAPQASASMTALGLNTVDQVHVVVVDTQGVFNNSTPGTILEVWDSLSRATDATNASGSSTYYKNVLKYSSQYVYAASDRTGVTSGPSSTLTAPTSKLPLNITMNSGADGSNENTVSLGALMNGYMLFQNSEDVDISLVMSGKARGFTTAGSGPSGASNNYGTLANWIDSNICQYRRDCVGFYSVAAEDVVNIQNPLQYLINFRNNLNLASSYGVLDTGYKYQYDKYNDVYRYVPLNGDIAGCCVYTDSARDAWWSPAGFNRGHIKNCIKLAYNPKKGDRDQLFKNDINPVVIFPGQGAVLFGDKTLYGQPSYFDAIGVRRLFIVLEKAIATAAQFSLFEQNDTFTRANFVAMVTPYLRDVQGRRGISDFKVVCDGTNNSGDMVDLGQFQGDIYIKPIRSVRFIQLNFVAVRSGVSFDEIVGSLG